MSDLLHDLSWSSRLSSSSSCSSTAAFVESTAARLSALAHPAMNDHSNVFSLSVPPQHAVSRLQSFDALLSSLSSSTCLSRLPSFSAISSYAPLPLDDSVSFDFHLGDDASYLNKKLSDGTVEYSLERTPAGLRSMSYESDGSSGDSLPPLSPHSTDSASSASSSSSLHSSPPAVQHQQRNYVNDTSSLQLSASIQQQPYYLPSKQPPQSYQPQQPMLQLQSKDQWAPRSTAGWYGAGGSGVESVPVLPLPATAAVHYSFSNNYSVVDDEEDSGLDSDSDSEQQDMQSRKRRQREDDYTLSPSSLASSPAVRTRSQTGGRRDNMLSQVLKQEGRRRGPQYDRPMDVEGDRDNATNSPTHSASSYSPSSSNGRTSLISHSPSSTSASAPSSPFTFSPGQSNSPRSLLLSLAQHARSSHAMSSTPSSASSIPSVPHRFASYTATASSLLPGLDPNEVVIGIYTRAERAAKIARYREKRANRQWKKKIMYDCRKSFADNRPRVGGRFIKMKEDEQGKQAGKEGKRESGRRGEERKEERKESKRNRR